MVTIRIDILRTTPAPPSRASVPGRSGFSEGGRDVGVQIKEFQAEVEASRGAIPLQWRRVGSFGSSGLVLHRSLKDCT